MDDRVDPHNTSPAPTRASDAARGTAADVCLRLVVFSDDWGRHPSSCQHLVGHLLTRYPVLWVNTIGTRRPRLSREDFGKALGRLRTWLGMGRGARPNRRATPGGAASSADRPTHLTVVSPPMYPGFRRPWQRRLNAASVAGCVNRALGQREAGEKRVAITTIPTTADLVGRLDVDAWVYYAVDDFSVWPGLDSQTLDAMERTLAGRVDAAAAVSKTIQDRLAPMGCRAERLTHGIEPEFWSTVTETQRQTQARWLAAAIRPGDQASEQTSRPVLLFWGVVDRRLDTALCRQLADEVGDLVLVGPCQSPDTELTRHPHIHFPGPRPLDVLPALAAAADVLVMPYADLPVTRAIQPLKLKEYLATGRPAVMRDLPATRAWTDTADVAADLPAFVDAVRRRVVVGVDTTQREARLQRLPGESWARKAAQLDALIHRALMHQALGHRAMAEEDSDAHG